jgi:hypothetical protein
MHNPERDPFYEGLWADVRDGVEAVDRGELLDEDQAFEGLLDSEPVPDR